MISLMVGRSIESLFIAFNSIVPLILPSQHSDTLTFSNATLATIMVLRSSSP